MGHATVLPFLLAMLIAVAAMPTNVFQVCWGGMGHEHVQPWRRRTAALRRAGRTLMTGLRAVLLGLRGHPLLVPAATLAVLLAVSAVLPHSASASMAIGAVSAASQLKTLRA